MSNRVGYRGYIGTRMAMGRSVPQHIQQLVMRDYCQKRGMHYLLAATEYRMPGCTMILDEVLGELNHIEGIVMYSLGLLPRDSEKRHDMYRRLFEAGCTLHFAAEGMAVGDRDDVARIEESWLVDEIMRHQAASDFAVLAAWDAANAAA